MKCQTVRLVAVSGLFFWDSLIAYSFHYYNEQEIKLIVKYSTRVMKEEGSCYKRAFMNMTLVISL